MELTLSGGYRIPPAPEALLLVSAGRRTGSGSPPPLPAPQQPDAAASSRVRVRVPATRHRRTRQLQPFRRVRGHRAHQVFYVGVERLQTFARELAFHHERHQHLLAHQAEAGLLHRAGARDELHLHREPPVRCATTFGWPGAACARNTQSRRSRGSRKGQQIQPCLDQFGMTDHHLHAGLQLPIVPIPSCLSVGTDERSIRDPDALLPQHALQSQRGTSLSPA